VAEEDAGVRKFIKRWTQVAERNLHDETERHKILACTGNAPAHWLLEPPTATQMTKEVKALKKLMHGRKRTELRLRMRVIYRNREQARKEGKYRRFIAALVGKPRPTFDMDRLRSADDTVVSDPAQIHLLLTEWFRQWFDLDRPTADTMHDPVRWLEFINNRAAFDAMLDTTQMKDRTKDLFWDSLRSTASKLTAEQRAEMAIALNTPPTREQFIAKMVDPRGGMTGGCTGLTYNMMAEWPLEVMNAMYDTMSKLDQEHHTPDFWRKNWLVPMPKNSDPTLAELRPLMLIEVSRKLWCSFGINSI